MGLEAQCNAQVGKKASAGKAHLETNALIFRGDFRLEIPFDRIRHVAVDAAFLVVTADDEEARFELGEQVAERWMKLIKQPKGLFEKLEIGPQSRVAVVDVGDPLFAVGVRERAASVAEGRVPEGAAVIFFGAETRQALQKIPLLRARMAETGAVWIVRPKASNAISEGDVLGAARDAGLVDTKVVAFSKTHTAHKCVVPVERRGQMRRRPPIVSIPPSAPELPRTPRASASKAEASPVQSKAGNAEPQRKSRPDSKSRLKGSPPGEG